MNDVFAHWELQRQMSSMQRLQEENARLRRQRAMNRDIAIATWVVAAIVAVILVADKYYGAKIWTALLTLTR